LFEEIKPNMVERIDDLELPLEQAIEELMDGDIFIFQKKLNGNEEHRFPTCKDYFRNLFYEVFKK
jgi:ubiquitin carboxyl-terminal hydrolase 7